MRVTAFRGCKNDCKRCNTPVLPVLLMLKNILHRFLTCAHFEARPDDGKVQARSVGPRVSPRAEEGLLACLLRLPRLLPAEQRVALGHEAGDARLWVRSELALGLGFVWGEDWGEDLMTPLARP